jgi:hypothetical protein
LLPLLDHASSLSIEFLLLELCNDTHKDSGGKDDLEEGYNDESGPTLVHSADKVVMQVEFADLQVTILPPANDFLIRKSPPPNLQIFLQGCSNAGSERIYGITLQFCGFGIYV